jgi:hypothetical protein
MKQILPRKRLLTNILVLVILVGALFSFPSTAAAELWVCEDGCWAWDIQNGCTQPVLCCAQVGGPQWFCLGIS